MSNMPHTIREFDENLPRYRCLLNTVHVKTGVFLIGVSHLVALLYVVCLQSGIWNYAKSSHFKEENYTSFVYNVPTFTSSALLGFNVAAIICLMHAIMTLKPQYLLPLLILLVCSVAYFLVSTVVVILALSTNDHSLLNFIRIQIKWASGEEWPFRLSDRAFKRDVLPLLTPAVFAFLGAIVVDLHFVNIVQACRLYLKEKASWNRFQHASSPTLSAATVVARRRTNNENLQIFVDTDDQATNEADYDMDASAPPPTYEEAVLKKT